MYRRLVCVLRCGWSRVREIEGNRNALIMKINFRKFWGLGNRDEVWEIETSLGKGDKFEMYLINFKYSWIFRYAENNIKITYKNYEMTSLTFASYCPLKIPMNSLIQLPAITNITQLISMENNRTCTWQKRNTFA